MSPPMKGAPRNRCTFKFMPSLAVFIAVSVLVSVAHAGCSDYTDCMDCVTHNSVGRLICACASGCRPRVCKTPTAE